MRTNLKPYSDGNQKPQSSLYDRIGESIQRNYDEVILAILVVFGGLFLMIQVYRYTIEDVEERVARAIEPMVIRNVNEE